MRGGDDVCYVLGDHLGSTSLVLNDDGTVHSEVRYYPYGEERRRSGTLPTEYRFTGQRDAGVGLYHMGARFYDVALGRWISADTVVPEPGNPQAFNWHSCVGGNPLVCSDPSGHGCRVEDGDELCRDHIPEEPPPSSEEHIMRLLQGYADAIYDPARMEPIQATLPDGTLLVIMPVGSSSERRGAKACTGIGLGMDLPELASIWVPGASGHR